LELAAEINKRAQRLERKIPVLIEVNIGDEATKAGLDPEMVKGFIESLSAYPNIVVQGLMTVAPYCEDKEEVRGYFRRMKQLFDSMAGVGREDFEMKYLSMGMSNDYEIAIEEGSNMVRLGTVLFGKRI
jgi:pyridoxal phosphate enzyme (YggS family)